MADLGGSQHQLDLPHLTWRESATSDQMAKAIKSGEAKVGILEQVREVFMSALIVSGQTDAIADSAIVSLVTVGVVDQIASCGVESPSIDQPCALIQNGEFQGLEFPLCQAAQVSQHLDFLVGEVSRHGIDDAQRTDLDFVRGQRVARVEPNLSEPWPFLTRETLNYGKKTVRRGPTLSASNLPKSVIRFLLLALIFAGCAQSASYTPDSELIFNGTDLTGWVGDTEGYAAIDSALVCLQGQGGNLYFDRELSDFELEFDFNLTPGANNGVGIRAEQGKDAAYFGMEIQVIDNLAPQWAEIRDWQAHGSIYGIAAARRGFLKPAGEWNHEVIRAVGNQITVTLNGQVIVDADIAEASAGGTLSGREHPGLLNTAGYIGFLGHGDEVAYRRIQLKEFSR
ncbi:MAG: hypothetical protein ACI9W4_002960 [Rhodothermales bacterium]|jgi:hypothetical protein